MRYRHLRASFIGLFLLVSGGTAHAQLIVMGLGETTTAAEHSTHDWVMAGHTVLRELGRGVATPFTGFANGMSVSDSVQMIVPEGWGTNILSQGSNPVSWRFKNKPWTGALASVMNDAGLVAKVDWVHHLVTVMPRPGATVAAHAGKKSTPVWIVRANETMRANVERWGKRAGWHILWRAGNWVPPASAQFTGDFQTALSQLIEAVAEQGGDLKMNTYTNRTLIIEGKGATQ